MFFGYPSGLHIDMKRQIVAYLPPEPLPLYYHISHALNSPANQKLLIHTFLDLHKICDHLRIYFYNLLFITFITFISVQEIL